MCSIFYRGSTNHPNFRHSSFLKNQCFKSIIPLYNPGITSSSWVELVLIVLLCDLIYSQVSEFSICAAKASTQVSEFTQHISRDSKWNANLSSSYQRSWCLLSWTLCKDLENEWQRNVAVWTREWNAIILIQICNVIFMEQMEIMYFWWALI